MLSFGYCIWLQPESSSELYNLTQGFEPHISLKTNMEYDEAIKIFNKIKYDDLKIEIINKPCITCFKNFYALQYDVKILQGNINIWMDNAHISFIYKYGENINEKIKINDFIVYFNKINIMNCNNHYSKWIKIEKKNI
tara:strand:+ start:594 stop:1007 length:414 start_codon:yes stop_codon:yes gene_type:complete